MEIGFCPPNWIRIMFINTYHHPKGGRVSVVRAFAAFLAALMLIFPVFILPAEAKDKVPSDRDVIRLQAEDLKVKQVIDQLQAEHSLMFSGISEYLDQNVTLSCAGSVSDVVKRLLKTLDIQNYAFTFNGERLVHVSILPFSTEPEAIRGDSPGELKAEKKKTEFPDASTVRVKTVLPGTQGERIPLESGDYIIAYNGHRIRNAHKLISYVRKYEQEDRISMVIVRDKIPMEFILAPGFIGVQVVTVPIQSQTLEDLYRASGL